MRSGGKSFKDRVLGKYTKSNRKDSMEKLMEEQSEPESPQTPAFKSKQSTTKINKEFINRVVKSNKHYNEQILL